MQTRVINTKTLAADLSRQATAVIQKLPFQPTLAVVQVEGDEASSVYVRRKQKSCEEVGIHFSHILLPATVSQQELNDKIDQLNRRQDMTGIILQLPLPAHLNAFSAVNMIEAFKDVDGLSAPSSGQVSMGLFNNVLLPATPQAILRILAYIDVAVKGKDVTVIGRSHLVGRPVSELLGHMGATVSVCHRGTKDITPFVENADILIVATGVPELVCGEMIKPGAVVVDVGITRTVSGLVGDVDTQSCIGVAGAITPVPGGVGAMTVASLITNIVDAALLQLGKKKNTWCIPDLKG